MRQSTAKLFTNGRSQALRIPKDFRFEGEEVYISKRGQFVVLSPKPFSWDGFFHNMGRVSDDFLSTRADVSPQKRDSF